MPQLFPLDCREAYRRRRWFGPVAACGALLLGVSLALLSWWEDSKADSYWGPWFVFAVLCLVGFAYLLRCPACNGPGPMLVGAKLGFCTFCGSRTTDSIDLGDLEFVAPEVAEEGAWTQVGETREVWAPKKPWWVVWLLGTAAVLIAMFVCSSIVLELERSSDVEVKLTYSEQIFGWRRHVRTVERVKGVVVADTGERNTGRPDGSTFRLEFETRDGVVIPSTSGRSGLSRYEATRKRVQAFLIDPAQKHATIVQPPDGVAWVAFGFVALATVALLFQKRQGLVFGRASGDLILQGRGHGGGLRYALRSVSRFGVMVRPVFDGGSEPASSLVMKLDTGAFVMLDAGFENSGLSRKTLHAAQLERTRLRLLRGISEVPPDQS